jgi:hypothetical protein
MHHAPTPLPTKEPTKQPTKQPTKLPTKGLPHSPLLLSAYSLPTPYPTPFPTPCYSYIPVHTPSPPLLHHHNPQGPAAFLEQLSSTYRRPCGLLLASCSGMRWP